MPNGASDWSGMTKQNAKLDSKSLSQERYSRLAERYVHSDTHAKGEDLERLFAIGAPQPNWCALDIATGGGHTALEIRALRRAYHRKRFRLPDARRGRGPFALPRRDECRLSVRRCRRNALRGCQLRPSYLPPGTPSLPTTIALLSRSGARVAA